MNKDNREVNDVSQLIEILEEHRIKCEKERKWGQAEKAREKIERIIQQEQEKHKAVLMEFHQQQKQEVEESYQTTINEFQERWEKTMGTYYQKCEQLEQVMQDRHRQEVIDFVTNFRSSLPKRSKQSIQLLNLNDTCMNLAKRKEYKEAGKIQRQIDQLEEKERINFEQQNEKKVIEAEQRFIKNQHNQYLGLQKKMGIEKRTLEKQKFIENEQIEQRYQNVRKQMLNAHNLQINKLDCEVKKGCLGKAALFQKMSEMNSPRSATDQQVSAKLSIQQEN